MRHEKIPSLPLSRTCVQVEISKACPYKSMRTFLVCREVLKRLFPLKLRGPQFAHGKYCKLMMPYIHTYIYSINPSSPPKCTENSHDLPLKNFWGPRDESGRDSMGFPMGFPMEFMDLLEGIPAPGPEPSRRGVPASGISIIDGHGFIVVSAVIDGGCPQLNPGGPAS